MMGQDIATLSNQDRVDTPDTGADVATALCLDNVSKSYGTRKAVDGVSLRLRLGECLGLLGPNGAGKTTTILLICGLLAPDSGTVAIGERQLRPALAAARKSIGYVPQEAALYDDLTAKENLRFFGLLCGLRGQRLRSRVAEILDFTGLADRGNERVGTYSGGMKRRLNIGVALLHDPRLLVLDEPTAGVDPQSRAVILDRLSQLRAEGRAILYSSHYMAEVEAVSTSICIMDHGRIIAQGTHADLVGGLTGSGERLILTCAGPAESAVCQLARLPGVTDASLTDTSADGSTLTVTVTDLAHCLKDIFATLDLLSVSVTDLAVDRFSLEKLFLELTGRELRDE
jgi:ABC-2 type transport system ATP-binding protein